MKRAALALLAFLGVACIVAAIAVPTYLVPKLKVVPLDLDITSVATTVPAEGQTADRYPATIFDRCSVTGKKAATLSAHLTQQRRSVIVDPSDADQATLQSGQTVQIDRVRGADGKERELTMAAAGDELKCDDALLTATIDRVSVNRKTSEPNGNVSSLQTEPVPEGGNVDEASVKLDNRKGFQYKFGFDVQKKDYPYYDTNTRQDATAKFVEEKEIDGVKTYHFVAEVPEVDLSDLPNPQGEAALGTILDMPAKWWGIKGKGIKPTDRITMHRYAAATRHVYVEPTTGTIIYGMEDQHQYFKSPDPGAPKQVEDFQMDALKGRFQWSDETVSQQADRAQSYLKQLKWGGLYAPIILAVVGVVLLLAWLLLVLLGRRGGKDPEPADDTEPTGDDGDGGAQAAPGLYDRRDDADGYYADNAEDQTTAFAPVGQDPPTQAYAAVDPDTPPDSYGAADQYGDADRYGAPPTEAIPPVSPYARPASATSPADVTDTTAFAVPTAPRQDQAPPDQAPPDQAPPDQTPPDDEFTPIDEGPQAGGFTTPDPTRPMPDMGRYASRHSQERPEPDRGQLGRHEQE